MIAFKAYLGQGYGLHFACTRLEGDKIAEEWDLLNRKARELTGASLGDPVRVIRGEGGDNGEPNPMCVLALILDETLSAHVEFELDEICVKDKKWPGGRRPVRQEKRQVTVVAGLPGEGDEGDV